MTRTIDIEIILPRRPAQDKHLTKGERAAARKPGVGGQKKGLWHNVWKKRQRQANKGKS